MLAVKRTGLCTAANAQMSGWSAWGKRQAPELAARKSRPERTWTINSGGAAAESLENPTLVAAPRRTGRRQGSRHTRAVPASFRGAYRHGGCEDFVLVAQQSGGDRTRARGKLLERSRIRGEPPGAVASGESAPLRVTLFCQSLRKSWSTVSPSTQIRGCPAMKPPMGVSAIVRTLSAIN